MKDYLGNILELEDRVVAVVMNENNEISLAILKVISRDNGIVGLENQKGEKLYQLAKNTIKLTSDMVAEERREKLDATEEAIQP